MTPQTPGALAARIREHLDAVEHENTPPALDFIPHTDPPFTAKATAGQWRFYVADSGHATCEFLDFMLFRHRLITRDTTLTREAAERWCQEQSDAEWRRANPKAGQILALVAAARLMLDAIMAPRPLPWRRDDSRGLHVRYCYVNKYYFVAGVTQAAIYSPEGFRQWTMTGGVPDTTEMERWAVDNGCYPDIAAALAGIEQALAGPEVTP
jgi:hypothetical protein